MHLKVIFLFVIEWFFHYILPVNFVLGGTYSWKEIWNTRSGASRFCNKPRDCKFNHRQWTRLQSTDWLPSLSPRPVQTNYFCWNCEWSASRGTWNILCQLDKYRTTATCVSKYFDMQFTASKVLSTNTQAYIPKRRTLILLLIPRGRSGICLECLQFPGIYSPVGNKRILEEEVHEWVYAFWICKPVNTWSKSNRKCFYIVIMDMMNYLAISSQILFWLISFQEQQLHDSEWVDAWYASRYWSH